MPRFVTIGYGDRDGYDRTDPEIRNAAHDHDREAKDRGAIIGTVDRPLQVRNPNGRGVETRKGAFMSAPLPVAGFEIFEAADISEAVEMASRTPCAVAHGVVEIWPLEEGDKLEATIE